MATLIVLGSQGQPLAGAVIKIQAKGSLFVPPYDDTVTTDMEGQARLYPATGLGANGRHYRIDVSWRPANAGLFDPTYKASAQWVAYWGDFKPARKEITLATTRSVQDTQRIKLGGPILFVGLGAAVIVAGPTVVSLITGTYLPRMIRNAKQ